MSRILLIVTAFIFMAGSLCAQVFPVQATVQLTPPYSLYLSDYVSSGSERLVLNLFLADVARPSLDVKFRLKIIGQGITIETKREYLPVPVSLQGGVPLRLLNTDLSDYFKADNLNFSGISKREYEQRGKLPEGVYQFCFEVLEYNRSVKISNTACGTAWLILNDPPIVNLPRQNEKLKVLSPQNILLQWTPRHTGSPNSAFTTQYEVTMVEVWPSTRNPNDAILTSPPIYQETTSATTVVYGPAETPLEPGRRYAFRIKAKSIAGVDELDLFKNNGYTEVISFVYGDACDLPTGIAAGSIGTSRFSLAWDGLFNHTAYKVHYREAGTVNWYDNNVTINAADIYSLKPNTAYEYQVAATCGFYDGQYSPVQRITTNALPETAYVCGVPMETFNLDPKELTGSLKPGDIIRAGDFDVKLTKVSGSNGIFSGEGVIEVPYFNKAKVKTSFTSISVNKELRMVNGFMNVTGAAVDIIPSGVMDAMKGLTEILNAADSALNTIEENLPQQFDANSFVPDKAIHVSAGISSVYKDNDGSVVIVDSKGTEQRLPPGTTAAISDNNGKGYLVDKKGNIHKTTAEVAAKAGNRKFNLALAFAAHASMKHGFDQRKHDALAKDYEALEDNYSVAWKSVPAGGVTDVVTAIVTGTGIDNSKIRFEQSGVPLQAQPFANNRTTLSVRGGSDGIEEGLLALYAVTDTGKVDVLGKLNVVSYNKISKSVVIVPVNSTKLPEGLTAKIIEDSLNAVYGQGVADWRVSIAQLPVDVTVPNPFDDGDSGLLANYTDDMKKVIKAFGKLQDETYYLFLIDNPKSSDGLGYMPRGKQAGFIFVDRHGADKVKLIRTMAHELGHGAFNLHHTFKEPNFSLAEGTTDNLMDYPAGNKLYKYQWDKMRAADIVIGLFEEDEEGQSISSFSAFTLETGEDSKKTCRVSPDGKLFDIAQTGGHIVCELSVNYNYVVQSLWKPIFGTDNQLMGYEDIIYKFKSGNSFGKYYPYNNKTKEFVNGGEPLNLTSVTGTCETILQKVTAGDACGYISLRKSGGSKLYLAIQGSSTPLSQDNAVSFIEEQIARVPETVQSPEALLLTIEEKIARKCSYSLGESACTEINVELLKKQKTEIEALITNGTAEALVNKLSETGICVLLELSYENLEKIIDKLAAQPSFNDKTTIALLNLMKAIRSNMYKTFIEHLRGTAADYAVAKHMIDEIKGDNYIKFVEIITKIAAGMAANTDDVKWSFINAMISHRYESLNEHERNGLTTIFLSMDENKDLLEKTPEITSIFFEMLLKDLKNLKDFREVYKAAILRRAYPEAFASFTQVKISFPSSGTIFCRASYRARSSSEELNWLKPVACLYNMENCWAATKVEEISESQLAESFEWSRFLRDNQTVAVLYNSDETKIQSIQKFIEQFKIFIEAEKKKSEQFWKTYSLTDCQSLNPALEQIQGNENATTLGKVDKQLRLSIVKSMFSCGKGVNEQFWKLQYSENALMKLLASFEKTDPSIMIALEEVGINNVCKQLEGDQFNKVSLWMAAHLRSSNRTKPLDASLVLDSDTGVKALFNGNDFIGGNKILQLEADMFQWENFSGSFTSGTSIRTSIGELAYNQEVLVYVAGDFDFFGQQISKGSVLQMPLIQAYAMSEGNRAVVFDKSIWFAFDIGTLAIGLGEVKILFKAGQLLTKAIIITDIAASTAGTIVNALNENYISPQLRSKIQLLSIVGSAPQMLRAVGKVDRLIAQADNALNEVRGIKNVNQNSENYLALKQYVTSIRQKIGQLSNTAEVFGKLLAAMKNEAGFMKNYNSLGDEMKMIFQSDFGSAGGDVLGELKKADSEFFEGWKKFRENSNTVNTAICVN